MVSMNLLVCVNLPMHVPSAMRLSRATCKARVDISTGVGSQGRTGGPARTLMARFIRFSRT